jgi:hypothetical protein
MDADEIIGSDEIDVPEPKHDRGYIGYIVIFFILVVAAIALTAGIMIYRNRYLTCYYNPLPYCPKYMCADGTDPIANAKAAVEQALQQNGGTATVV